MTNPLIWASLILVLGLLLLIAELFIPSGGVLGILAAAALIGSILLAFSTNPHGTRTGTIFLLIVAIALPTVIGIGLKLWPKTPLGRRMLLDRPTPEEIDPHDQRDYELSRLVGRVGRTITQLRPSGMTDFDGRRVDTIAEGMIIEAGTLVRVVDVKGRRVIVRMVEDDVVEDDEPQPFA